MMYLRFFVFACSVFLSTFSMLTYAASPIYTKAFSNKALKGYDVVSYFTSDTPVKGLKEHSLKHKGATWLFSSAENLELFKATPQAYEPQYGGYCAWAVGAKNDLAPGNPKHWSMVDGKLYLNYNSDIKNEWLEDTSGFIGKADKNWPNLIK